MGKQKSTIELPKEKMTATPAVKKLCALETIDSILLHRH